MDMLSQINGFVNTMTDAKDAFAGVEQQVQSKEQAIEGCLSKMSTQITELIQQQRGNATKQKDAQMNAIFDQVLQELQKSIQTCGETVAESVRGMQFISNFDNRFTVAVFGKVKSGKSYLGNFVMGRTLKEAGIASAYDALGTISVSVYDRGHEYTQDQLSTLDEKEIIGEELAVGKQETTSTIQWFDIGGLSWFDTPGIGSVTWENELLAKEYVKNSDLVVYACNSDAAGTRQDFTELRQLCEMGKPVLLLLTQSDTIEDDIDEDGNEISELVPKSPKDRQDTQAYMLETLQEMGLTDILKYTNVLTVSTMLANIALETGDETRFEQSNMGTFLQVLESITKSEGAAIKLATPKNRLNKTLQESICTLTALRDAIATTCHEIDEKQRDLDSKKEQMLEEMKSTAYHKVLTMLATHKQRAENKETVSKEELQQGVDAIIQETVKSVCLGTAMGHLNDSLQFTVNMQNVSDMKMKQDSIAYEHVGVYTVSREPEGVFEKIGSFFGKEYTTSKTERTTKHVNFDIGTNATEVEHNIMLSLEGTFKEDITQFLHTLTSSYFLPVRTLNQACQQLLTETIQGLEALRW